MNKIEALLVLVVQQERVGLELVADFWRPLNN